MNCFRRLCLRRSPWDLHPFASLWTTCHPASENDLVAGFQFVSVGPCFLRLVRTSAGSRQRYFRFIFSSSSMTFVLAGANLAAVEAQSFRDVATGSMARLDHQACSLPSDGCPCDGFDRQSGTVNSSLTLRPIARGCVNCRWWALAGLLPQIRHGCDATNLRWALSRCRRGSLIVSSLSILAGAASA